MKAEHYFLHTLYAESKGFRNKRKLDKASRDQLHLLARILHCLREGK
jgi:hypothetical protein